MDLFNVTSALVEPILPYRTPPYHSVTYHIRAPPVMLPLSHLRHLRFQFLFQLSIFPFITQLFISTYILCLPRIFVLSSYYLSLDELLSTRADRLVDGRLDFPGIRNESYLQGE